jgi:AraC-like DNA-binding protein
MNYKSPAIRYEGDLNELLHRLLAITRPKSNGSDHRMAKLTDYIDSRGGQLGCGVEQVCRELKLDISGAYAARLFKRSVGFGIREYSKRKRLSAAAALLETTEMPVKAIAAELGYRSAPDFTRGFKKQFNLSPTEFRTRSSRRSELSERSPSTKRRRALTQLSSLRRTA